MIALGQPCVMERSRSLILNFSPSHRSREDMIIPGHNGRGKFRGSDGQCGLLMVSSESSVPTMVTLKSPLTLETVCWLGGQSPKIGLNIYDTL